MESNLLTTVIKIECNAITKQFTLSTVMAFAHV